MSPESAGIGCNDLGGGIDVFSTMRVLEMVPALASFVVPGPARDSVSAGPRAF